MDIARDVRVVKFLPAYFGTISQLLALLSQDEPSFVEIEQAVGADQSLTSRLLTTVNSPVYGAVRQIGTIDEAVVRVGLVGLRNLALAVSISDITGGMKKEEWKHSISVAHMTDILARRVSSTPDVLRFAFVAGLMHDIGKLFLTRRYMLEYQSVMIKVRNGFLLTEAEQSTFGYDHATVGGLLQCLEYSADDRGRHPATSQSGSKPAGRRIVLCRPDHQYQGASWHGHERGHPGIGFHGNRISVCRRPR